MLLLSQLDLKSKILKWCVCVLVNTAAVFIPYEHTSTLSPSLSLSIYILYIIYTRVPVFFFFLVLKFRLDGVISGAVTNLEIAQYFLGRAYDNIKIIKE